jgi:hypothetical protein
MWAGKEVKSDPGLLVGLRQHRGAHLLENLRIHEARRLAAT